MSRVLNKFRKRNIQANFLHFALVVFVVAVSVCLITGLVINYLTLSKSVDAFYTKSNLPNLWLQTSGVSSDDEDFLSSRFEYDKRFRFDSDFQTGEKNYNATFLIANGKTSVPYIIEGEKEHGCYVDAKFAKENNFGLNHSKVFFNFTFKGETKPISFSVVGFISMAENLIVGEKPFIFIDEKDFLETLSMNFDGVDQDDLSQIAYNEILIKSDIVEKDVNDIAEFYETSQSELVRVTTKEKLSSVVAINKEIDNAKLILIIFPIIFIVISILVIVSAISQFVIKERYNIGLLKSIGIGNSQILSNYAGYGTAVCLMGAILGLLVAPLIVPNITFATYDKLYNLPRDEMNLTFPILTAFIIVIVSGIIGYLTSLLVCMSLTEKSPKECMSKFSKSKLGARNKKRKGLKIVNAPLRSMKLNLARTIMSIVGLAGSSLLILLGFGTEKILLDEISNKKIYTLEVFSRIFKGFSICLMVLTVVLLLAQIFKEKHQEMAVRRIHGESYLQIWLSVLFEMMLVGLSGFVISVLLSGPIMLLNFEIFGIGKFIFIDFLSYLKTFLLIFLTIAIVAGLSLVKIYKLKLSNAIKFSEWFFIILKILIWLFIKKIAQ